MAGPLASLFQEQRQHIERALRAGLECVGRDAPSALVEAMSYSLLAPGKRLRPLLTVLACEATGGKIEQALPGACAMEMVHAYSLIHDDLPAMDDDDLRRGLPTCHKKYGQALAILAGDALLTGGFQVVAAGCPPTTASVSVLELALGAGSSGMVAGQVLDLGAEGKIALATQPRTTDDLENIHRRKTGALFLTSLQLGLIAAQAETGIDAKVQGALARFGRAFGLAFQIADDLLDVQSSSERTGKRVGKDASRGKLTFPGLIGIEASRERLNDLHREANDSLDALGPAAEPLRELTRLVTERDR